MILLDTNILSELMRPAPEKGVEQWLADQPDASVFISAITKAELRYGVASLSPDMAIRLAKAFGASMENLMRMQNNYDIAFAHEREADIRVVRYVPKDAPHIAQPELS